MLAMPFHKVKLFDRLFWYTSMDPHTYLSTYLVKPSLSRRYRHNRERVSFATRIGALRRANPRVISRLCVGLVIWAGFFGSISYIGAPQSTKATLGLASSTDYIVPLGGTDTKAPAKAQTVKTLTPTAQAPTVQTASVSVLTPGPTGQAAPPAAATTPSAITAAVIPSIYISPPYTFANAYDAGQCTWYVAGRRRVPSNWGNADNWYYGAERAGWRVGSTPVLGAIAQTSAGWYGHVALVEGISSDGKSVEVTEMNYDGPYIIDSRWTPTYSFRYIYHP
jgi:surface antigen